jgi:CheY-like chemotaxis protein
MSAAMADEGQRAGSRVLYCPDGSRPRVLLAEDSMAARFLMSALLSRMGCDVDAVEHGEDAVSHAETNRYDVILLDIEMPVMDGVAAARQIRAMPGPAASTPLMAFSAFLADSARSGVWRDSFDMALAKPAGRKELHEALSSILVKRHIAPEPVRQQPDGASPEDLALIEPQSFKALAMSMRPDQFSKLLVVATAEMIETAGLIAGHLDQNDLAMAQREAHKLKGLALSFSAPRLAALCGRFEEGGAGPVLQAQRIAVCAESLKPAFEALLRQSAGWGVERPL